MFQNNEMVYKLKSLSLIYSPSDTLLSSSLKCIITLRINIGTSVMRPKAVFSKILI